MHQDDRELQMEQTIVRLPARNLQPDRTDALVVRGDARHGVACIRKGVGSDREIDATAERSHRWERTLSLVRWLVSEGFRSEIVRSGFGTRFWSSVQRTGSGWRAGRRRW